jgi:hypothetical protein
MFKPKPTHLMDWEQDKINRFTALSKDYTPISGCITQVFWEKGWVIKVLAVILLTPKSRTNKSKKTCIKKILKSL